MGSSVGGAHPPVLAPSARRPSGAHDPWPCQPGVHAPRWGADRSDWLTGGCASPCGRGFPPATLTGPARAGKCANPLLLFHRKQGETYTSCQPGVAHRYHWQPVLEAKNPEKAQNGLGIVILRRGIPSPRRGIVIPRQGIAIPRRGIGLPRQGIVIPRRGIGLPRRRSRFPRRGSEIPRPVWAVRRG